MAHPALSWVAPLHLSTTLIRRRAASPKSPRLCTQPAQPPLKNLSTDDLAIARSAVRATRALRSSGTRAVDDAIATLSTSDLLAFCAVKGLSLPPNIWDRGALHATTASYARDEAAARRRDGAHWAALSDARRLRLLHAVCNAEGDATYVDPASGYTVFSAFAHLRRDSCCGVPVGADRVARTHRCRHCPYDPDGCLNARPWIALRDRLHVVDYVRRASQAEWHGEESDGGGDGHARDNDGPRQNATLVFGANPTPRPPRDEPASAGSKRSDGSATNGGSVSATDEKARRAALRRLLVKKVDIEHPDNDEDCDCNECADLQMVTCRRCNGWTILISPVAQTCPQCNGEGMHPCLDCTSFRPPPLTDLYS